MKSILILFIFLYTGAAWSKVIDHSVTGKRVEIYTLKEACQTLGHTELLLVDKKDRTHLDCMGTYEKVTTFCEKKFPKDKTLTRGYIDDTSNQVICERGANVTLKVACDKRDLPLCRRTKEGCEKLRKIFAVRHKLYRHTLVKFLKGKALNCFYTSVEDELKDMKILEMKKF